VPCVPLLLGRLELHPLLHAQHAPDGQHHHRIFLLELPARGGDQVDLGGDLGLVGSV
jgi:hypothetical protein